MLSASLLDLGGHAVSDPSVVGLELLESCVVVVDKGEASRLSTTVLGSETEDGDCVLGGLVELSELLTEFVLGDVGSAGVEDVTIRDDPSAL